MGPTAIPPPPGMVSWWPGDGNADDIWDGNDGTLTGDFAQGMVGQAFSFDGTGDFVLVPDSGNLNITGDVTVDLWAKKTVFDDRVAVLVDKGAIATGTVETADAPGAYFLFLVRPSSGGNVGAGFQRADGSFALLIGPPLSDSNFHHYAYVRSGNTHKLFVDGIMVASGDFIGSPGDTSGLPLVIGASRNDPAPTGFTGHFGGIIDEVEIFNRALTDAEIQAIYNAGSAGKIKPAVFSSTGSMALARRDHTATLLSDGRVLIQGWTTTTAEVYDPTTGTFTVTGSTLCTHRQGSTATRLTDGRVLVVGGNGAPQCAELYDPATGVFTQTGNLNVVHTAHTATLLPDGRVLIAAGSDPTDGPITHAVSELYDPTTGTFSLTGSLNDHRHAHTATLLPDGKVLIAGGTQTTSPGFGISLNTAELYDPAAGTFSVTGNMTSSRSGPRATLLPNGKVLILSGRLSDSAELYDPSSGTFSATGNMTTPRCAPSATLLPSGQVLVAGGCVAGGPVVTDSAELYDPAAGTFTATASMSDPRQQHTATLLLNGDVLVVGGYSGTGQLSSAELYLSD